MLAFFLLYSFVSCFLTWMFFLNFICVLLLRLEQAVLVQTPSLRCTRALICSLQMCLRIYVCRSSRPHLRMFHSGTIDLPRTLRFVLPLQLLTSMTMGSLSWHTPPILRSLDQFTIGLTGRTSTLPKTGLA